MSLQGSWTRLICHFHILASFPCDLLVIVIAVYFVGGVCSRTPSERLQPWTGPSCIYTVIFPMYLATLSHGA
jgi:hypothetical protein